MDISTDRNFLEADDHVFKDARTALDAGDFDKAVDLFSSILRRPALAADIRLPTLLLRSHGYSKLSRKLRAIPAAVSEMRAINFLDPLVLAQLALRDADKALQLSPASHAYALACKGEALLLTENLRGAHEAILEGLSVDPSHPQLIALMQELAAQLPNGGCPVDVTASSDVEGSPQKRARRQLSSRADADEFDCTLCLKLLFEPVTTPCGHSFCRSCLFRSFDHGNKCPMCRKVLYLSGGSRQGAISVVLQNILEKNFPEEYSARRAEVALLASNNTDVMPLFVMDILLPGQRMALNIFEPRYRLMVRRCMEGDRHFGMVGLQRQNTLFDVACECEITECEGQPDGRFYIEVVGKRRFEIKRVWEEDGYRVADVGWIQDDPVAADAGAPAAPSGPGTDDPGSQPAVPEQGIVGALVAKVESLNSTWVTRMREVHASTAAEADLLAHAGPKPSADNLEAFSFWVANVFPFDPTYRPRFLLARSSTERLQIAINGMEERLASRGRGCPFRSGLR